MKNFIVLVALGLLVLVSSCDTLNIGSGQPQRLSITMNAPVGTGANAPELFGSQTATFSASIIGVNGPFNISWNFGGAATNTTSTLAVAGTSTVTVTFVDLAAATDFTATATVVDSAGVSQDDSVSFTVGPTQNKTPEILTATFAGGVITVTGTDEDLPDDTLTYTAALDSGDVTIGPATNASNDGATFAVSPNDIIAGGSFTATVTVTDDAGATDTATVNGTFDAFPLDADTLYAIATSTSAGAGDSVRIAIATGDTANSFQYMNGCGVVCENGATYTSNTFDCGAIDGEAAPNAPIDGVWADMGATSFLLGDDSFIVGEDLGDGTSRTDFNVTPLGGSDITANGLLFNFEYTFASAGTYTLGFEAVNVVSRTYYQDSSAATDFFWGDISNTHDYNTITVN